MDSPTAGVSNPLPRDRYVLPEALRGEVSGIHGTLLQTDDVLVHIGAGDTVIAVGDVVSKTLHDLDIKPLLFVCDYKTQRGDEDPDLVEVLGSWGDDEIRIANPAATITRAAWKAVRDGLARDGITRIVVDGEEDLLAIPCFVEAPVGAKVLYGRPGHGMVLVDITPEFQIHVRALLRRFEQP